MSNPLSIEYYKNKKLPEFKNGLEMLTYIVQEVTSENERSCDHQKAQPLKIKEERMKTKVSKKKPLKKESSSSKGEEEKGKSVEEMTNQEWISCIMRHKNKMDNEQNSDDPSSSNEPSRLPEEFQREISKKCGGSTPNRLFCVIKKSLTKTDVSKDHSRLSLPCNQLNGFEFLEDEEVTLTRNKQAIQVMLTHKPRDGNGKPLPLTETMLNFGQWNLHSGRNDPRRQSPQYVLRSGWNNVVSQDQLKEKTPIEVWAFRDVESRLCMALVELPP